MVLRQLEVTGRHPSLLNVVCEVVGCPNPPPSVLVDPYHLHFLVLRETDAVYVRVSRIVV